MKQKLIIRLVNGKRIQRTVEGKIFLRDTLKRGLLYTQFFVGNPWNDTKLIPFAESPKGIIKSVRGAHPVISTFAAYGTEQNTK